MANELIRRALGIIDRAEASEVFRQLVLARVAEGMAPEDAALLARHELGYHAAHFFGSIHRAWLAAYGADDPVYLHAIPATADEAQEMARTYFERTRSGRPD